MAFSLVPKNTTFDTLLSQGGDIAHKTATTMQRMLGGYPESARLMTDIKSLEHEGDRVMRSIVAELTSTFVTPYDREDIYELANSVDDVIDNLDEAASLLDIYQVEAVTNCVKGQADILVAATQELAAALRTLSEPSRMEHHWQNIHKLEDAGDELYRTGIKEVFAACYDEPAIIICWKDIYQQMEEAIDSCERAASILEQIAVKNS